MVRRRVALSAPWNGSPNDEATMRNASSVIGVTANLAHTLSRRSTADVSLTYRHSKFEGGEDRTDDFYTITGKLTYQMFRNASAVLSYSRTQRKSNVDVNDLTENSVVLGLRREF